MSSQISYLTEKLSKHTSFLGIRLWILVVAFITSFIILALSIVTFCVVCFRRNKRSHNMATASSSCLPHLNYHTTYNTSSLNRRLLPPSTVSEIEMMNTTSSKPELQIMLSNQWSNRASSTTQDSSLQAYLEPFHKFSSSGVSETWVSYHFSLREVGIITNGFAYENLIGYGDFGVVYRGVLLDDRQVAVKRLLSKSFQIEEFIAEAEAVGHVRHKNLIKLIGYCLEEGYRILVCEYVNTNNLHQWLHGSIGQAKPLTWTIRMNIIRGIAKGLAYLHEDIEPSIVHQNVKACNVLLDHQWNAKISDVALSRLLDPEHSIETVRSMVKLGIRDKENDVYSFGILVMEIITGRTPVDHNQSQIYLIEWLKSMVADKRVAYVVDPKIVEVPCIKELKRIILIALRCVDSDLEQRPKMGDVLHMLEPRDLLLADHERRTKREASLGNHTEQEQEQEQEQEPEPEPEPEPEAEQENDEDS